MALDLTTLSAAKSYTDESLQGVGAIAGKNCTISSITPITGGNRVTFSYTLEDGTVKTSTMDVMDGKDGSDGKDGVKGSNGEDGLGISKIEKVSTVGLVDTYKITFTDNSKFEYDVTNGAQGIQGIQGIKGDQGERGIQGLQGVKGDKGDDGYPFLIYKEYSDIADFNVGDFPEIGLMFMIKASGTTSFPVYRYTGDLSNPYSYITDLTSGTAIKGDKGDKGDDGAQGVAGADGKDGTTYQPVIGNVTSGTIANASVTVDNTTSTATFDFVIPKGDKGDSGKDGTDGITPHIDSTTKHWFIGSTDTNIVAEGTHGADGTTPHIDQTTNNWFIGTTDTGVSAKGADGRSIQSITKDSSDNIIVTFSDRTTQIIGKLSVDIQGDFLTSDGIGNLRYYNGHFQYYDTATSAWVDTSVTPSNIYILNMPPQPMRKMTGKYDVALGKYKLQWDEPKDTIIDGQVSVVVEKVIIRRKLGSIPTDENDGDLVIEISRKDFHSHKNSYYTDNDCSPNDGEIYYYKAFPISTTGFVNKDSYNEVQILCKDYYLYGFKLDQNESDPNSMITYLSDCDNATFTSAYMDYNNDVFNYGDWKDVWFIRDLKPCMLKYDGTVDCELDPNDYTKKLDGTASDIDNESYDGNAMIGVPKVYWKIVDNGDDTANVYISDKQVDSDFHCWSHIDNNGKEIDYCYMPIYNGYLDSNNRLRSLSGKTPLSNKSTSDEITYAKANNTGSNVIWYTEVYSDRMLINLLLLLIGKSTDTQTVFGTGNNNSYVSTSNTGIKNTGTMNTKGLFWGNQDNVSGVKVFGIEHWYGNIWRRIGGWINDKGTQKIKMTYGQSDGSTIDGYNETGSGYISIGGATPSGTSGGYISKMLITDNGLIPTIASGSATTYYCDGLWFNNSQVDYARVGGSSGSTSYVGALSSALNNASSHAHVFHGAALSCKPLV